MKSSYAVNRRVTKAQEIIYTCGTIQAVVNPPIDGKRDLLVVVPTGEYDDIRECREQSRRHVDALVTKAKARDGVAGHRIYNNHDFNVLDNGAVQIVARANQETANV